MESAVPILIVSAVIVALFVRFLYEVVAHKDAIQAIAELTDAVSVITNERDEAIAERNAVTDALVTITKERDELQAKLCKIKG